MTRFEKMAGYPDEIQGRFNSFITTQFDDSLSVEMQIRSLIKWITSSRELVNDIVDYINLFIEMFDERLQEEIVLHLNEWLDDGTLAQIINHDVFDMKADQSELDLLTDTVTSALNQLNDSVNELVDLRSGEPYNISIDGIEDGDDITTYLQDKIDELGDSRPIYIPTGTYYISHLITIGEGTQIIGNGKSTTLHFKNQGKLFLGYRCRIDNFNVFADYDYDGSVFYLDSRNLDISAPLGSQEKVMILISRIHARKEFNPTTNSKFMYLYGDYSINTRVGGFYGLTAENIEVDGFNNPLHLHIMGGWIHANFFNNWLLRSFTVGVKLQGGKRLPEESDTRIRRNKFHNFLFQPNATIQSQFIEQTHDFPNDWQGLDIWDITRWSKYTKVGGVHVNSYVGDDFQNSFTRYGVNLASGGHYPFATTINQSSEARMSLYYYESPSNYADIHIMGDQVSVIGSRQYDDVLKFHIGSDGIYYVSTDGSIAFGSLYFKGMRNAGNLPWHKVENPDTIATLGLQPLTEIKYVNGNGQLVTTTSLLNGHTGQVTYAENGHSVTVTGKIDSTNATQNTVLFVGVPNIDVGSDYLRVQNEPWVGVSRNGYLLVSPTTEAFSFTFSFVRE